jgi:DNA-binding MarR family transcriptional regulator
MLQVQRSVLAEVRDQLQPDMTLSRFDLLANLLREDGQTPAALSRRMLVTAGNLTGLVDRAARDGLVVRRTDPSDRRTRRVHLTTEGKKLCTTAARRHKHRIDHIFRMLRPAEIEQLIGLLEKLRTPRRKAHRRCRSPHPSISRSSVGSPSSPCPGRAGSTR